MANIKNDSTGGAVLIKLLGSTAILVGVVSLMVAARSGWGDRVFRFVTSSTLGNNSAQDSSIAQISATATTISNQRTIVGVNLNGISDWSTQWPFVDMFKSSRSWISQREGAKWGEGGALKLTPEGWVAALEPGQRAETIMMIDNKTYPSGKYTLLYEGDGKMKFGFNNVKIVSQAPGKMVVDVTSDGTGVFLNIVETNPSNPIRNIRFIMPGFENTYQTQPFHPLFLERLSKFKVLRFMDWGTTNGSSIKNWSDRSTPNLATQATNKGVALEYMIQLANTLKIDPWFTIPAQASDDYVRQFALMLRDRLDPSLKAHIEYSNEIWNFMFPQAQYSLQQGKARNLDTNDFSATLRFYSERSVEIFKIFDTVFGSSRPKRIVRVLAGQAANSWTAEQILGWKDAYKHADAYAIAPYLYGDDADNNGESDLNDAKRADAVLQMSTDQIIDSLLREIPKAIKTSVEKNYAIATKQYGLELVAYEGGIHLTSYQFPADKEPRITQLFGAANRNPRMREVYRAYLNQWQSSGGKLFNQFVDVSRSSKWGSWGALEYQNQDINQAPKYLGLMDFINANPKPR